MDNLLCLILEFGLLNPLKSEDLKSTVLSELHYRLNAQMVPFAEYIPFSRYFPILKKLNFGQGNFSQGEEYTVFKVDSIQFSNIICYESSLPDIFREFIKRGAQFLSIQANDGWLGNSSGPYQHFELAKLRAIENRISVVRSANTGISGIILPTGRVMEKISIWQLTEYFKR